MTRGKGKLWPFFGGLQTQGGETVLFLLLTRGKGKLWPFFVCGGKGGSFTRGIGKRWPCFSLSYDTL